MYNYLRSRDFVHSTSDVQMPIKIIPELFKPAFGVLPRTGDAEPEDPGKPGWERSRTICARSILAWHRKGDALGIDRHGVHSWRRLRLLDMLRRRRRRQTHQWQGLTSHMQGLKYLTKCHKMPVCTEYMQSIYSVAWSTANRLAVFTMEYNYNIIIQVKWLGVLPWDPT